MIENMKISKLVLLAAVMFGAASALRAADTPVNTISARQDFSASAFGGQIYLNVVPYNLNDPSNFTDDFSASSITWSYSKIVSPNGLFILKMDGWLRSDVYLQVTSSILEATGGIQIYTDNASLTTEANPAHRTKLDLVELRKKYGSTVDPTGLYPTWIDADLSIKSGEIPLPLAWRITDVSTDSLTVKEGAGADFPKRLYSAELSPEFPCWIRMVDLNTPGINGDAGKLGDISKIKDAYRGLQMAEGSFFRTPYSTNYIYFAADFRSAFVGVNYKARIVVEAFTE